MNAAFRCSRRAAVAALLSPLLAAALPSGAALAHAILLKSTPALNGTIAPGHQTLHFEYNSRIDHKRSRLTLNGPGGSHVVLPVSASSPANALDAEADLKPGSYTLRWQALAVDGHITRGDVPFTVGDAPAADQAAPAAAAPKP
ncbi:copper resistance CopC family protein [Rhizosaccharibacter radicis]|uniref:Copper resistance protein CopC n=1 Tax=Rhizosaccharibacter radicis TaxID=2782605 RepID=A0ABT1W1V3_9PROT|nr:copper resistance protein CopC [Acetobacteraceae bacterium KSS12]